MVTANRSDGEADVVLISTKDGNVIQNLTSGFDKDWEGLGFNSEFASGRSLAFDPSGDNVGFFGRTGKGRSFFLISALDGKVKKKVHVPLDETQAPCLLAGRARPCCSRRSRTASRTSTRSTSRRAPSRT